MQKKNIVIVVLTLGIIYLGYLQLNKTEGTNTTDATFIESIRLTMDKDYETKASRTTRAMIENRHAENLRLVWGKKYPALESRYSDSYILLGDNKTVDFVEEIKKESNSPWLKKDVNELFDFTSVKSYSYKEMISEGFTKEFGTDTIQEGDFFAVIQPNKNSPDSNKVESFVALYRNINGEWIAIGGLR